jgi:hypothetical protein
MNIPGSRIFARGLRRSCLACAAVFATTAALRAQLSLTDLSSTVTITFDSTLAGVNNDAFSGLGFQTSPTTGQLDSNAWATTGWSDGALAFGGTQTNTSTDFARGLTNQPETTSGIYAFDDNGNRSLMIKPSGADFTPGTLTLRVQNNTGSTLTSLTVAYDLFVLNDQNRSNSFNFSISTDDATFSSVPSYNFISDATADGVGRTEVTSPTTFTPINLTLSAVAPGDYIYLRWSGADAGGTGSRDTFYLDNISVSAVPEPSTYAALAAVSVLLAALWRRRRGRAGQPS